jgi:excisionase family DNA binding protein
MPLLTVEDLEKDSQVSRFTWRTWIAEGRIRAVRLGRRIRVDEDDYRAFKDANTGIRRLVVPAAKARLAARKEAKVGKR